MHHDLDIHPIPEKVLYINDLSIADTLHTTGFKCRPDIEQTATDLSSYG